ALGRAVRARRWSRPCRPRGQSLHVQGSQGHERRSHLPRRRHHHKPRRGRGQPGRSPRAPRPARPDPDPHRSRAVNDPTAAAAHPAFDSITTVTCVGDGTIGGGWAAYVLAQRFRVRIWDPAADVAEKFSRLLDAARPARTVVAMAAAADSTAWWVDTDLAET